MRTPLHELLLVKDNDPVLGSIGFVQAVCRALLGRKVTQGEVRVVEAALVGCIWNGKEPASVQSAYLASHKGR